MKESTTHNTSYPTITKGMITIPYRLLKEAINRAEKKQGTCHIIPSARFEWEGARTLDYSEIGHKPYIQVGEHMPSTVFGEECATIEFTTLVCDQIGGESTGTAAEQCENCLRYNSYSKNNSSPTSKIDGGE